MIAQGSTTYPAAGLLVFQTDGDANEPTGLYFFDGTAWRNGAGVVGAKGDQGIQGPKGDAGAIGPKGETGLNGLPGATGPAGTQGIQGLPGANGAAGAQGPKGDTGLTGTQGPKGDTGDQGQKGDTGLKGDKGDKGATGDKGDTGDQGAQGLQGPKGDQGGVTSKIYTIGLWPELGGYVFKISADGTHGLVAETQDQSVASSWYLAQDAISNPVNHSTNGQKFMDWRLPTKYELNEMYLQKGEIGGFTGNYYWSSTEYDYDDAWRQNFYYGSEYYSDKYYNQRVRSVRAF